MYVQVKTLDRLKEDYGSKLNITYHNGNIDKICYDGDTFFYNMVRFMGSVIEIDDAMDFSSRKVDESGWFWSDWMYVELERHETKEGNVYYLPIGGSFKVGELAIIADGSAFDGMIGVVKEKKNGRATLYIDDWGSQEFEFGKLKKYA